MIAIKERKPRIISLLLAAALLLAGLGLPVSAAEPELDSNTYQTIDGGTQAMWSSGHKLTIAVFGKESCPYTWEALQYLDALGFSKEDVGLCYIDVGRDSLEKVQAFAEEMATPGITYCFDTSATANSALADYIYADSGMYRIETPTYIFTDNAGMVRKIVRGAKEAAEIERIVESLGYEELVPEDDRLIHTEFNVTYSQADARAMLARINEFRTGDNAWEWSSSIVPEKIFHTDLQPLTYDYELEKAAMQRAAELVLAYSHTRPNGTGPKAAYSSAFEDLGAGENIAIGNQESFQEERAFTLWLEEDEPWSGQGHRRNMLNSSFQSIGVAHIYFEGCHYWVQEFSTGVVDGTETEANNSETKVKVDVSKSAVKDRRTLKAETDTIELGVGESKGLPQVLDVLRTKDTWECAPSLELPVSPEWSIVSGGDAVSLSDGKLTALKDGKAVVKASYDGIEIKITVIAGKGLPDATDPSEEPDPVPPQEEDSKELTNPYYNFLKDQTTWSYLYMGRYPQSEVTDRELKAAIDKAAKASVTDGYADVWVTYNGCKNKYRKMKIDKEYHYFKWEPIRWKLMQKKADGDATSLYLIADKGLDVHNFNDGERKGDWEDSALRKWLNGEFYDMAFDAEAKKAFLESAEAERVSLIPFDDVSTKKYGFLAGNHNATKSRVVKWSDYALRKDAYKGSDTEGCVWWLQSKGLVLPDGQIALNSSNTPRVCVPVVRIQMEAENAWSFHAKDIKIEQTLTEECQEKLEEYENALNLYDGTEQEALRKVLAEVQAELEKAQADGNREAANTAMARMEAALKEKTEEKKHTARQELQDIRTEIGGEGYDGSQKAEIEAAISEAEAAIEDAPDVAAVKAELEKLKARIQEINLQKERSKALNELDALEGRLGEYRAAERRRISAAIKTARTQMKEAQDAEAIKAALAKVNNIVSNSKTDAQLKTEEALDNGKDGKPKDETIRINLSGTGRVSLSASSYTYNGKEKKPGVTVTANGKKLTRNQDYTVSYQNNKNVGTATLIVTGAGGYEGTLTKTFSIVPKGTSISKITGQAKRFSVRWKKQAISIDGYEVSYSTSKKFTKKTTATKKTGKRATKLTVKKLKAKKKYYVKVRTYKNVKGKKYVSSWSKAKSVTTKK